MDFDGTLFQGDSFNLMFRTAKKEFGIKEWMVIILGSLQAIGIGLFKGKEGLRVHFFKTFARTFKGKNKEIINEFFEKLIEAGKDNINQNLVKIMRENQKQGNQVMILSGALTPFLKALTRELKLSVNIIGTDLLFDSHEICTGKTAVYIGGDEKVRSVKYWLNDKGLDLSQTKIWAYADSKSDIPLLYFADKAIIVNPKDEMRKIAKLNRWEIFKG